MEKEIKLVWVGGYLLTILIFVIMSLTQNDLQMLNFLLLWSIALYFPLGYFVHLLFNWRQIK